MNLHDLIESFCPWNDQEAADRDTMLGLLSTGSDLLTRQNTLTHFTASAWVVSPDFDRVLMAHHNQYNSWAWLGGHADGDPDLSRVALREVREESGLERLELLSDSPISLEILTVFGHEKRGSYVPSHLHLNLTFLIRAFPQDCLRSKEDENSAVAWFTPTEALHASTEPWFVDRIYSKLIAKTADYRLHL